MVDWWHHSIKCFACWVVVSSHAMLVVSHIPMKSFVICFKMNRLWWCQSCYGLIDRCWSSLCALKGDYIRVRVECSGPNYFLMNLNLDLRLDLIIMCTWYCYIMEVPFNQTFCMWNCSLLECYVSYFTCFNEELCVSFQMESIVMLSKLLWINHWGPFYTHDQWNYEPWDMMWNGLRLCF